jgi:hypothetical protein
VRKAGLIVLVSTLILVSLLLLGWLGGLAVGFAGSLIHLLLVVALLVAPVGTVVGVALLVMGARQQQQQSPRR